MLATRALTRLGTRRWASSTTMVWGDGGEGQLGHYPFERTGVMKHYWELLPRVLETAEGVIFRSIACGANHTLAVDEDGGVWSWGKSDYGKCGHGDDKDQEKPKKIEALKGVDVVSVACGDFHSAAIDSDGRLYTWGWGGSWLSGGGQLGHGSRDSLNQPELVKAVDEGGYRVSRVSCGEGHTLLLTDDGETLSCGAGEHGRNGNGTSRDVLIPEPVDILDDKTVVQLESGSAFSIALTDEQEMYVWGRNDQGQLGLGGGLAMDVYAMEDTPRVVEVSGENSEILKANHVSAGHSHAACVGTDGSLYYWGMKAHLEPFAVHFEDGHSPEKVYAGGNYTFTRATDNSFHSFGLGRTNCLGHGDRQGHAHPKRIEALDKFASDDVLVSCGFRHVALIASSPPSSTS